MTRKEQKEARRVQIIEATLDLFVERGYYGTKTSQISRRAGISEGLLFAETVKNPFIAKMFVFMGHMAWAEDIPEKLRRLAVSVDVIAYCKGWVEAGQRDGSIRKGDVMSLSNMYWCAIHGIMEQYALRPEIPLPEPEWLADMLGNGKNQ